MESIDDKDGFRAHRILFGELLLYYAKEYIIVHVIDSKCRRHSYGY